jgi:hypothetical protein
MAVSTVDIHIQNPAGKRSNMTAKQIKYFGSKRQKAALKAHRKKARHSSAKKRHAPAKRNAAPKKHRKVSTHLHSSAKKRKKSSHRSRTVKRNTGMELVTFVAGNSARRKTGMAHSKKKRKKSSAASRRNAGTRRKKSTHHHSRRRGNPAGIPLKDFAFGGAGVLGGFLGSAAIPQMILGGSNTGMTGYAVTAAAGIGLTILTHMFFPRQRALTFGVGAGAAANLLRRIISDQTPFGGYLSNPGLGDYMVANWGPPLMTNGLQSAIAAPYGTGVTASSGVSMSDMADIGGGRGMRPC